MSPTPLVRRGRAGFASDRLALGGSSDEIADAVDEAGSSGKPFRLSDVTDFEWDRFYVFEPYSSPEAINERLGFEWGGANNSGIEMADWMALLVFVRDGEVVKAFDQDFGDGDFSCLGIDRHPFTPNEAVLRVKRLRPPEHGTSDVVVLANDAGREQRCVSRYVS